MPKTYKHLYQEIISFENLYLAFKDARRLKSEKPEVLEFSYHAEERLWDIHNKLEKHIWVPSPYREFLSKTEVKRRVIHAPAFADRVVHMALFRILMPIFEERFIYDSYACRKNKGTLAAVNRTQDFLRRARNSFDKTYVLQGDFQKCYDSIYKPALLRNFARRISDHEVLDLLTLIYYSYNDDDTGIPIGATTSQLAANVLLDSLDHFVKEELHAKFYLRYMDDFIILSSEKDTLWSYFYKIKEFSETELRLNLNKKTRIFPSSRGINFCGYRTWWNHILPRRRNVSAARKRFKTLNWKYHHGLATIEDIKQRIASFRGYMSHCNGAFTEFSVLNELYENIEKSSSSSILRKDRRGA